MKKLKTVALFILITLFGCTEENNYYTTAEGLGKVNVYIEGNITNAEAQAKLIAEIGTQTENIYVQNTSQLSSININFNINLRDIYFNNNKYLKNICIKGTNNKINKIEIEDGHYLNKILINGVVEANQLDFGHMAGDYNLNEFIDIECHDLVTIHGNLRLFIGQYDHPVFNKLNFYDLKYINKTIKNSTYNRWQGNYSEFNMPELEEVYTLEHFVHAANISYPKLKTLGGIAIGYGPTGQTLTFPVLEDLNGSINFDQISINSTFNFPLLKICGGIGIEATNSTFNFSSLKEIINLNILSSQININFPLLEKISNRLYSTSENFTILNLPSLNYCLVNNYEYYPDGGLPSSTVNTILSKFITIQPLSGKTIRIDGEQPTGQGLTDLQTLVNQGNSVLIY
ncbi:hypothetical protein [Flavobacterium branchiophilum]|uniref:Lipoprotein n=3 Tax=Flavobacterium branchiophilum TaxID=55197 RepID=A0A543G224_9FLAO|nr:hypothetical protein [Flavobacterium branchiophilum]TQM40099.1 hypothetical protein BC670_0963 [Flavobacterium branchiophilum]